MPRLGFLYSLMNEPTVVFWATIIGAACWPVCFWWMHRISTRQAAMLLTLQEQGERIEKLSKEEHDLIQKVHPEVEQIRADVADVKSTVRDS